MTTLAPDLTDRYEFLEALSGSGLYAVYRARDRSSGGVCMIRVPRAHVLEDTDAVEKFRVLMADVQRIDHHGALHVLEVGGSGTDLWIVSEDSSDSTLKSLLPEGIELGRALESIATMAETVEAVHQVGALHGDIRLTNAHLSDEGRTQLAGAGISFLSEAVPSMIRSSMQSPLPSYQAPEVLRGARPSVHSDIYALGMLLYEVTTGSVPFPGNSLDTIRVKQERSAIHRPSEVNGDLPGSLDEVITKALAWEPQDRQPTAQEFARDVRALRGSLLPDSVSLIVPSPEARDEIRLQFGLTTHTAQSQDFLDATEAQGIKVCPTCLTLNTRRADSCAYCWRSLESVPVLSTDEGEEFTAESRRRTRRRRLIRRGLLFAGVAVVAVVLMAERNVPPGLLSGPPTTDLTAEQGTGLWTTPRNGTASTGVFMGAPSLPAGTLAWSRELGQETVAPITISDGKLLVATRGSNIFALDAVTGDTDWELETTTPLDVSAVIADDYVFVVSRDSRVTAVELDSGDTIWSTDIDSPSFGWVGVDEGNLFTVTNDGRIHALDAATGTPRWRLSTGNKFQAAPAVSEGRLVIATLKRRVLFLNAFTGATNLTYLTRSAVDGTPATVGNVAFIAGNDQVIRAVNVHANNKPLEKSALKWWAQFFVWGVAPFPPAQSGTIWTHYLGEVVHTSAAATGERVIVAGIEGTVWNLNADDGKEVWRVEIGDFQPRPTSPIVINNVVYIGTESGRIHALDAASGNTLWTFDADAAIAGNPAFADGFLYFVTIRGTVYALE
jgi:outer membrane protein assembly factor BamB/serine/threonine protein kinase